MSGSPCRRAEGMRHFRRAEESPEVLPIGVQFADGRKATNTSSFYDPEKPPPGPVIHSGRGGGGDSSWREEEWVWPLRSFVRMLISAGCSALGRPGTRSWSTSRVVTLAPVAASIHELAWRARVGERDGRTEAVACNSWWSRCFRSAGARLIVVLSVRAVTTRDIGTLGVGNYRTVTVRVMLTV
jgi:hypothetical protein